MGKELTVAVVGATGEVGRAVLEGLAATDFPVTAVRVFASERSKGESVEVLGEEEKVASLSEGAFRGCDLALFCAPEDVARTWAPRAIASGCPVVDVSAAFRNDASIPLVLPEVNPEALDEARERKGIVSCPGPLSTALALSLSPFLAEGLRKVVVTALASASGAGRAGVAELERQARDLLSLHEPEPAARFPYRIAFNALPQVGAMTQSGETEFELATARELRRVLGLSALEVSLTVVRVPVFYGELVTLHLEAERAIDPVEARERLEKARGVKVIGGPTEPVYPMPMLTANEDSVLAGRIRSSTGGAVDLVLGFEAARRGAATTALALARLLTKA